MTETEQRDYIWTARYIPFAITLAVIFIGIASAIVFVWADKGFECFSCAPAPANPETRQLLDSLGKIGLTLGILMVVSWVLWAVALWVKDTY